MANDREHQEQAALIQWARNPLVYSTMPGLFLLHAIPNGGKRSKGTAGRLKAEGVLAGIPDLFLPVSIGEYHGFYLEMKTETGDLTPSQKIIIPHLLDQGYQVGVFRSWVSAARGIIEYYQIDRRSNANKLLELSRELERTEGQGFGAGW